MQLRTRLLGAIVLMAAGLTAAMFFRRAPSEPPPIPQVERPPVLRQRSTPPAPQATVAQRPNRAASATKRPADSAQQCPATVVEPVDRMPPPQLPATYPDFVRQEAGGDDLGARSPLGLGMMPSAPIGRTQRRIVHTIVDGDSLPALAERYLGSADRWPEIYRANEHLLSSPELLPIGVQLAIPLAEPADTAAGVRQWPPGTVGRETGVQNAGEDAISSKASRGLRSNPSGAGSAVLPEITQPYGRLVPVETAGSR